ncbi:MAG: hypothetical protein WC812_00715 [Candidatus Pacearchaeota archaeon]|jgi:hypothetical protein
MRKIIQLKKEEKSDKIELFDYKKIFQKGYLKSETYGAFNKQGFKLMSLEESQKFLNNLWDNETFEQDYNLMRFRMIWHMNFGCKGMEAPIENSMHLFRYALTKKSPFKSLSDEDDTILRFKESSLIFPVNNLFLKGEFYLGPILPEIENFKIYRGKERFEQLKNLYAGNKNLEKEILEYLKDINTVQ